MITIVDRKTKREEKEKVYGQFFLELLYGNGFFPRLASTFLLPLFSRIHFLSWMYGVLQKSKISRWKIRPFIEAFEIDTSEFADSVESMHTFNDFFTRHLKPEARPMAKGDDIAVLPADARYLVFQDIDQEDGFWVKGKKFSLTELFQDERLAEKYKGGAMVIARLCPIDYHRFHFPFDCRPGTAHLINGALFSVNPIALKRNIEILSENKRMVTSFESAAFGTVQYIEVGATNVGSIIQTYRAGQHVEKGAEKGYFSFGGSCLIILFEKGKIVFDQDLVDVSKRKIEMRGLLGQSLGKATR